MEFGDITTPVAKAHTNIKCVSIQTNVQFWDTSRYIDNKPKRILLIKI